MLTVIKLIVSKKIRELICYGKYYDDSYNHKWGNEYKNKYQKRMSPKTFKNSSHPLAKYHDFGEN